MKGITARHYFSVVVLNVNQTPAADDAITLTLSATSGYRLAAQVRSGNMVFSVWAYFGLV